MSYPLSEAVSIVEAHQIKHLSFGIMICVATNWFSIHIRVNQNEKSRGRFPRLLNHQYVV